MRHTLLLFAFLFTGCTTNSVDFYTNPTEFDWMPNPLQWERNIRDCRSQPQCNAADLFNRTA